MSRVRRINARRQLFRQLQIFFEEVLTGVWTISDVSFDAPEMMAKEFGRRQLHREVVSGHFGPYTIVISSPEEKPPLGEVVCHSLHGFRHEGHLDARTWRELAVAIRLDRSTQGDNHVDGIGRRRAFC
jgi:hypothetical protein